MTQTGRQSVIFSQCKSLVRLCLQLGLHCHGMRHMTTGTALSQAYLHTQSKTYTCASIYMQCTNNVVNKQTSTRLRCRVRFHLWKRTNASTVCTIAAGRCAFTANQPFYWLEDVDRLQGTKVKWPDTDQPLSPGIGHRPGKQATQAMTAALRHSTQKGSIQ